MNTRFRATCPPCGTVLVQPGDVTLLVGAGDDLRYEFRCPECSRPVSEVATQATAEMLQGLGAVVIVAAGDVPADDAGS